MRISFKRLEELANNLEYRAIRVQEIGKNNYYYYYRLIKDNKTVKGSRSVKELVNYLLECDETKAILNN